MASFEACNIYESPVEEMVAHEGNGLIRFARLVEKGEVSGPCNFVDFTVVPPGVTIGSHQHGDDEEEFYLILKGDGELVRDGRRMAVRSGDFIRNRPGGTHALRNNGTDDLHLFVFEISLAR